MIDAVEVGHRYGAIEVLRGCCLRAGPGERVGLIGPNGSGKTTLLRTLYRSLAPRAGLVSLDGAPLQGYAPQQLARRIAVLTQDAPGELAITAAQMVLLGRAPHRSVWQSFDGDDRALAQGALAQVGCEALAERPFSSLSGGEQQRVLVARALCQGVDHLLLDEPTNHLDIRYQHEILDLVCGLDVAAVLVLHDLNLAARYCTRIVLLDRGGVVREGTAHDVLTPEILEPVYGLRVRALDDDGYRQLVFSLPPRMH